MGVQLPLCPMTPPLARSGLVNNCVRNVDNVIVQGKGVWNEHRVSFRISALISVFQHTSQFDFGIS